MIRPRFFIFRWVINKLNSLEESSNHNSRFNKAFSVKTHFASSPRFNLKNPQDPQGAWARRLLYRGCKICSRVHYNLQECTLFFVEFLAFCAFAGFITPPSRRVERYTSTFALGFPLGEFNISFYEQQLFMGKLMLHLLR